MTNREDLTLRLIRLALEEDCVNEDITTNSLLSFDRQVTAGVTAKGEGVISGVGPFIKTFEMVDPEVKVTPFKNDGDSVVPGDLVFKITGSEGSILKGERTALNFLQRLSGVASLTARFVRELEGGCTQVLDTRKTTPGMRYLQKKAVKDGGGTNHRMNLADMAMIKDNHIKMAGTITQAVQKVREANPGKKIEVEVKDLKQLAEAIRTRADIIMLDNFSKADILEAVKIKKSGIKYEISGNVTLNNIGEKVIEGIDYISVGFLTHSFTSLDLSLNIME